MGVNIGWETSDFRGNLPALHLACGKSLRKPLSLGSPSLCTGVFRAISRTYKLFWVVTSFPRSPGVTVFEIKLTYKIPGKPSGLGLPTD